MAIELPFLSAPKLPSKLKGFDCLNKTISFIFVIQMNE